MLYLFYLPMEIEIGRYQEYRIEILENQKVKIMVTAGLAEIKGQELLNDKWYNFTDIITGIFTFTGAKLKIDGTCHLQYIASNSCFPKIFEYFDTNYRHISNISDRMQGNVLDNVENIGENTSKSMEPVKTVLVMGKGRTTFCTTISNYFVRMHKEIDFIELDPSKGNLFPGSLSLLHIDCFIDHIEKFKLNNPISFFYGSASVDNDELFDTQTSSLATEIEKNRTVNSCFRLVLCPELSVEELNSLAKKFKASEAIVIGNERLFHRMNLIIPKVFIENTGYVQENTVSKSIFRYFNGTSNEYTPCSFIVKYDWEIVRIGEQYSAPESALPLGATRKVGKTDACKTELTENSVLAISEAESEDRIVNTPVVGFIVCLDSKKFRVLCTQSKLPKLKYLIQGNIKYIDF